MSDHASPVQARRRADVRFAVLAVCAVGILGWIVITMTQLSHDLRTANGARDALARQVQQLGGTPVAGSPGSRGDIGPSGPQGERGPSGPSGPLGPSGSPGGAGKTGQVGTSGSPGAAGASGSPGVNGADGAAGVAGSPGPAGPQGEPGPAGVDGRDGQDGSDGSPPAGWTYTDPSGTEYECVPVDGFDPASPQYTCSEMVTSSPSPTLTESGLGVVALVSTAAYRRRL